MRRNHADNLLLTNLLGVRIIIGVSRFCCIQRSRLKA